jgi:osmotically-inducible protein OsmY
MRKRQGSVILTLRLSAEHAERLLWAAKEGRLADFGVSDARIVGESVMSDLADAEIIATIKQAILRETEGKIKNLSVVLGRRGVVLRGRCNTYYARQQAQVAAMRLLVGEPLVNEIEVK